MSHIQRMEEIKKRIQSKKKQDDGEAEPSPVATPAKVVVEEETHQQKKEQDHLAVEASHEVFLNTRSHKKGQLDPIEDDPIRKQHHRHEKGSFDLSSDQRSNHSNKQEKESASVEQTVQAKLSRSIKERMGTRAMSSKSMASSQGQAQATHKESSEPPKAEQVQKGDSDKRTPVHQGDSTRFKKKAGAAQIDLSSTVATERPSGKANADAGVLRGTSPLVTGFGHHQEPQLKVAQPEQQQPAEKILQTPPSGPEQLSLPNEVEMDGLRTPANSEEDQQDQQASNEQVQKQPDQAQQIQPAAHNEQIEIAIKPPEFTVSPRKIVRLAQKNSIKEQERLRRAILNLRSVVANAQKRYPDIASSFSVGSYLNTGLLFQFTQSPS